MKEVIMREIELNDRDLNIEGIVHYHIDVNYGADSDGTRGSSRTFIDDVTDVSVVDAHTFEDVKLDINDIEKVEQLLVNKFLEQ